MLSQLISNTNTSNIILPPIFTHTCPEKRGTVIRSVAPMMLTMQNLHQFWQKASQFPTLFDQEIVNSFDRFLNVFIGQQGNEVYSKGLFWVVDDFVGVFYMTDIIPGNEALVHFTFFDRIINGRLGLTKKMIAYVFNEYKFHRLSARIPMYASVSARNFIKKLGFKQEGLIRHGAYYDNAWHNVCIYGLLEDELVINEDE